MAQKMSLQPCRLLLRNVPPVLSLNAAILATLLALVSVARADDDLARGEALVGENCGRCHAIGRTGTSAHGQAPAFRTLGQRYPIEVLEEALGEGIMSGHPDMPEFTFEPHDVGGIIANLRSIQQQ